MVVDGEWGIQKAIDYIILVLFLYAVWIVFPVSSAEPVPFNASIGGDRNLNQPFTFTMENVSGTYATNVYHYTVYDYRIIGDNFTYYSVNWGRWNKYTADPGKKYLIVWVRGWMNGTAYFGWGQDRFRAWSGVEVSKPEPVLMQDISIRNARASNSEAPDPVWTGCPDNEPEYEPELNPLELPGNNPLGSSRRLPAVILEIENLKATTERLQLTTEWYGWKDENELDRHEPGSTWDGYMMFQINETAQPQDLAIAGWFRNYGTAVWHLTKNEIDQDSAERYHASEVVLLELERETGLRLPDRADEEGRTEA